jgi:hypothetical protein
MAFKRHQKTTVIVHAGLRAQNAWTMTLVFGEETHHFTRVIVHDKNL